MTIATYTDLQTALSNWLDHSLFASRYPDFIQLFEATANRRLRVKEMESLATLTPATDGTALLPSDYLAYRRCTWTGSTRNELRYVQPAYFQAAFPSRPSDAPRLFTIESLMLKVMPLDSTPVELEYYQKIPALAYNSTNWLLTSHPDVYLFGSIAEAEMFGVNDERMPLWKARRDEIFDEIEKLSKATRSGPGTAIHVMGVTP
jgi:hypothetical protein